MTADSEEQQKKLQVWADIENNRGRTYQVGNGMFTGVVVGLFVCCGVCVVDLVALGMGFPILEVLSLVVCVILGGVFKALGLKSHRSKAAVYERQLQEEVERFQKDLATINNDAKLRCDSYRKLLKVQFRMQVLILSIAPLPMRLQNSYGCILRRSLKKRIAMQA